MNERSRPDSAPALHTAGPWHLGKDAPIYKGGDDYLWSLHVFAAPRSPDDADTNIAWVVCRDDPSQDGEDAPRLLAARANARLIVAAPDLKDAASKARWALGAMVQLHGPDPAGMALHALNALDAAIAKARGVSQ